MRDARLFWWIFPAFLVLTLLVPIATAWLISSANRDAHLRRSESDLESRARLVAALLTGKPFPRDTEGAHPSCARLAELPDIRITVISWTGRVICDSAIPTPQRADLSQRPEVARAMLGFTGTGVRYSDLTQRTMMYVAVPVFAGGAVAGVVRASDPLEPIAASLGAVAGRLTLVGVFLLALAGLLAARVARRIARPLRAMQRDMERLADPSGGGKERHLVVRDPQELAGLAESLNRLVAGFQRRMDDLNVRRNEQDAVFASMMEAVIAVDQGKRILNLNRAGARLFSLEPERARGRRLLEVVRNPDLLRFIDSALAGSEPLEGEIALHEPERVLKATGTVLRDRQGRRIGALAVLDDVTRLRRLETMRRDFVANVSHELKTPITAIKGFVETLLDGAMERAETAERFLRIIARHVERLSDIVEDLLRLSRIEREGERGEMKLALTPLAGVLRDALEDCQSAAEEKGMHLEMVCGEELSARINAPLIESALVNLLDNALKHSERGGRIRMEAREGESDVVIAVRDWGRGIPASHIPRLFERFHRVDPARSRREGGTGLGLAIVKHIVQAHGGRVDVRSRLGEGSTFFIHLPRPERPAS